HHLDVGGSRGAIRELPVAVLVAIAIELLGAESRNRRHEDDGEDGDDARKPWTFHARAGASRVSAASATSSRSSSPFGSYQLYVQLRAPAMSRRASCASMRTTFAVTASDSTRSHSAS